MRITNKHGLPETIVRAVTNDPYTYTGNISVTQLIKAPRQRWLEIRHDDELVADVVDRIWMLLGSAIHYVLEQAEDKEDDTEIIEKRLIAKVGEDWEVSGQADRFVTHGLLQDYKFTSVWAAINGPKEEWIQQINMLAYLHRAAGYEVNKGQIITIYRDWSKKRAQREPTYPQVGVEAHKIPLWPNEEVEEFILSRIKAHKDAEELPDDELPLCTDKERWQKPTTWAVKKNKNKRAVRVLETEEDAYEYAGELTRLDDKGNKYWIEERPGEWTRCKDYCPANQFCNQYLRHIGHLDEELEI